MSGQLQPAAVRGEDRTDALDNAADDNYSRQNIQEAFPSLPEQQDVGESANPEGESDEAASAGELGSGYYEANEQAQQVMQTSASAALVGKIMKSSLALLSAFCVLYTVVYFTERAGITPEKVTSSFLSLFLGTDVMAVGDSADIADAAEQDYESGETDIALAGDDGESAEAADSAKPPETDTPEKQPSREYTVPYFSLSLTNETPYTPDMDEILALPRAIPPLDELYAEYGEEEPVVLILHTHGSESFSGTKDDGYRSSDRDKNVCALGDIVCSTLEEYGINTVHCDTLFDSPDFNMAYYNASLEIRRQTEEHPSIKYIIDVHRDSMTLADGTDYAPAAAIDSGKAAQMMFVVGTDWGGSGHESWRENLSLAARLQCLVSGDYPSLMRDINLRSASFNQQYAPGSLILEVGAAASELDECKISAGIFAEALAREIIG